MRCAMFPSRLGGDRVDGGREGLGGDLRFCWKMFFLAVRFCLFLFRSNFMEMLKIKGYTGCRSGTGTVHRSTPRENTSSRALKT